MSDAEYNFSDTKPSRRHTWRFLKSSVVQILVSHLKSSGIAIPAGERFVWGIESDSRSEDALTLVVDQGSGSLRDAVPPDTVQPKSSWIATSERAPTEKDADRYGDVLATYRSAENSASSPKAKGFQAVAGSPDVWPYWMPIPALPEQGGK